MMLIIIYSNTNNETIILLLSECILAVILLFISDRCTQYICGAMFSFHHGDMRIGLFDSVFGYFRQIGLRPDTSLDLNGHLDWSLTDQDVQTQLVTRRELSVDICLPQHLHVRLYLYNDNISSYVPV